MYMLNFQPILMVSRTSSLSFKNISCGHFLQFYNTVKGYKEKALAVRPTKGLQKLYQIRYFWFFTLLGLTVPYRIRFGKNCDELRVAVVKETSAVEKKPVDKSSTKNQKPSWLSTPRAWIWGNEDVEQQDERREKFTRRMQEMSLYQGKNSTEVNQIDHKSDNEVKVEELFNSTNLQQNVESPTEEKGKATNSKSTLETLHGSETKVIEQTDMDKPKPVEDDKEDK